MFANVKQIAGVILCIFIAVLLSAASLYFYRPATKAVLQTVGSQNNFHQVLQPAEFPPIPIKQASLADLPTAIQSLSISDGTPIGLYWVPRDQRHIIARVLAWLKTAAPYEGKIPPTPTVITIDYVGPSQLYLTTPDHRHLSIYPAYYYTVSKQNAWTEVQANYIPDVIVLWSPTGVSYFKSEQLYGWLKTDQWKMEFVPE
jgi:hypothetical protein